MSKTSWAPALPRNPNGLVPQGIHFCYCCQWRLCRQTAFCDTCLDRAAELGGPKPPPQPPRLTWAEHVRVGDPAGLLPTVHANNAAITAAWIAAWREAGA